MRRADLRGLGLALRLLTRRHRWHAVAWLLPLWALIASVAPTYESIYPDPMSRAFLVREAQNSPAMTMLLGEIVPPGAIGQLVVWKPGSYVLWCVIVMAIVHTAGMARRDEQDGLTETLLSSGAGRWTPFASAAIWMLSLVGVFAVGIGAALSASVSTVEDMTLLGAWSFAGVVAAVGWTFVSATLLISQFTRDQGTVRGIALAVFAAQWGVRIAASEADAPVLHWFSPLAWRDLVDPYGADRPAAIVAGALAAAFLLGAAAFAHSKREMLGALLTDRSSTDRRWALSGPLGLRTRLGARHFAWWTVATGFLAAFFGSMTGSMEQILYESPETKAYLEMLGGSTEDMIGVFMRMLTGFTALLVLSALVQRTGWFAAEERRGSTGTVLAQGASRTRVYAAHVGDLLVCAVVLLGAAAAGLAATTAIQLEKDHAAERAVSFTLSQGPGMLAAFGLTCAIAALFPRLVSLSWVPVGWSSAVAFIGELLHLPEWAKNLTFLGIGVDVVGPVDSSTLVVLATQAGVGAVGIIVGWWAFTRRDLAFD